MANKSRIFKEQNADGARAYDDANTVNEEGHPAFERPLKERTLQLLLTNTLSNTFYVGQRELAEATHDVYDEILDQDPAFFARAISYARNEGCMRLQPVVGLVYLSTLDDKELFHDAFDQVIYTPKDLSDFVEWCLEASIRDGRKEPNAESHNNGGLGRTVKRAVNRWLNDMSQYHAIKYPMNNRQYSLANILRLTRPVPTSEAQSHLFAYVVDGWDHEKTEERWVAISEAEEVNEDHDVLEQVACYEALKHTTDPERRRHLIERGRLPHEIATGVMQDISTETWSFIMREMPHFALLRNLNTLQRHDVLGDEDNVDYVVKQLTDREIVENARMLPFRYHSAWMAYTEDEHDQRVADAVVTAMEVAVDNFPELPGRVVIASDKSGSMRHRVSEHSETRYCDIAGIFSACLLKKSPDSRILLFDRNVHTPRVSRHDSVLSIAEQLAQCRGGTDVGAPIQAINNEGIEMDTFIGITDDQQWHTKQRGYRSGSQGFYGEWVERENEDAQAFLIRIDPYKGASAPEDDSVQYLFGWSESLLDIIHMHAEGFDSLVDRVEEVEL